MKFEIPFWLAFLGSWLGLIWAVYRLFKEAGDTVKEETKLGAALWLLNLGENRKTPTWPSQFAALFDRVFTENHWSWQCFFRSAIASSFGVFLVYCILYLSIPNLHESFGLQRFPFKQYLQWFIAFNLFVDYLSLLQTRYFIKLLRSNSSRLTQVSILLLDLVLSALLILVLGLGLIYLTDSNNRLYISQVITEMIGNFLYLSAIKGNGVPGTLFFYTTFLTSIWLWLYLLSGLLIKVISLSQKGIQFLKEHLNVEEKPFRSMGFVVMLLITFTYLIWAIRIVVA